MEHDGEAVKSHIDRVVLEAEANSERLSAYLRLLSFLVLFGVVMSLMLGDLGNVMAPAAVSMIAGMLPAYGLSTAIGVWLAHRGFFRPWLPWAFTTADVAFLVTIIALLTFGGGMPFTWALSMPAGALIFLIIAHAALRLRPMLAAYAAFLFAAAWVALYSALGNQPEPSMEVMMRQIHAVDGEVVRLLIAVVTAAILAVAVARARRLLLLATVDARRAANLSRYLPPNLAAELAREGPGEGAGRRIDVAVLFADVHGFTALAENMDPHEVAEFLNEFRRRTSRPIFAHGGTLDKVIGDAVMAVFGAPMPGPNAAASALACASDLLKETVAWSEDRQGRGMAPVSIGVGVHYGPVIAGTLGDENRLEYTVVGDTVNTAQRIEHLTRDVGAPLLVSAELLSAAGVAEDDGRWDEVPQQVMRGRTRPVRLFRLKWPPAPTTIGATPRQAAQPAVT